jgi:hypothetical protein
LAADQSAELQDRLLAELKGLKTADDAAHWAYWILPSKNSLIAEHAGQIETAFGAAIASFGEAATEHPAADTLILAEATARKFVTEWPRMTTRMISPLPRVWSRSRDRIGLSSSNAEAVSFNILASGANK